MCGTTHTAPKDLVEGADVVDRRDCRDEVSTVGAVALPLRKSSDKHWSTCHVSGGRESPWITAGTVLWGHSPPSSQGLTGGKCLILQAIFLDEASRRALTGVQ